MIQLNKWKVVIFLDLQLLYTTLFNIFFKIDKNWFFKHLWFLWLKSIELWVRIGFGFIRIGSTNWKWLKVFRIQYTNWNGCNFKFEIDFDSFGLGFGHRIEKEWKFVQISVGFIWLGVEFNQIYSVWCRIHSDWNLKDLRIDLCVRIHSDNRKHGWKIFLIDFIYFCILHSSFSLLQFHTSSCIRHSSVFILHSAPCILHY